MNCTYELNLSTINDVRYFVSRNILSEEYMSPETLEILQTLGAFILVLMALLSMRIIAAIIGSIISLLIGAGSIIIVIAVIITLFYFGLQHFIL